MSVNAGELNLVIETVRPATYYQSIQSNLEISGINILIDLISGQLTAL